MKLYKLEFFFFIIIVHIIFLSRPVTINSIEYKIEIIILTSVRITDTLHIN